MSKQLVCQKYVYKIHSQRLRDANWDLSLPIDEARRNDEVIALADSQMLRWIDELNGNENLDERAREIKREIRSIKKQPNSVSNKKKIRRLYEELDSVQFKPDYMCLIIDKKKDYYRACKGFKINGIEYMRLLGTPGGLKNSTIVFVSKRLGDELKKRVENGRNPDKPLVTAKLEAYKGLTCSASNPVSFPNGVIVVNDCETRFKSDILYLDDECDGEPLMELRKDQDIVVDASDGYGLMLPSLAERWSEELGLDYMMAGCNTRQSFEKGMLFTFDFVDFAEKIAGSYIVKDAWGVMRDVREAEVIMTTSMLKLWDSYDSWEHYLANCLENKYTFSVTKTCPKELENVRTLNYQFIQSYDLDDDDISDLVAPTLNEIKDILGGDWRKAVLFLRGSGLNEENIEQLTNDYIKAIMIDRRVLDDPYVQNTIYDLIKFRIRDAKIGVLNVHGNYSIISGDPYALCQNMFGLEVTGLLRAGEIYNRYWIDCNSRDLVCFRAPMTCHNNIRRVKVVDSDVIGYWYRYMNTCTILNAWDTTMSALNGCDFDSDTVMLTDNPVLLRRHGPLPALTCVQRKADKRISTEKDFIESNLATFGNDIGRTTNYITSMFEVRSHFEKGSSEYNILSYRIQCGQLYQQNSIDKAKGCLCKPMPREWYDWHSINKMDDGYEKDLYHNVSAEKKPYFMIYIYPSLMRQYKKYVKDAESNALREYGMTIDELCSLADDEVTDEQRHFLEYYKKHLPVGDGPCVMNKICRIFENEFDGMPSRRTTEKTFDYDFMKSGGKYSSRQYYDIKRLYDVFNSEASSYKVYANYERVDKDTKRAKLVEIKREYTRECSKIVPNSSTLCDITLDLCYKREATKRFTWEVSGDSIIENLLERNGRIITFPKRSPDGEFEYCGDRYTIVTYISEGVQ